MFSPSAISTAIEKIEAAFSVKLREYPVAACREWADRLAAHYSEGKLTKPFSKEEQQFIQNELFMTRCSFSYVAERYFKINVKGAGLELMFPLLEAQRFVLARIAKIEEEATAGSRHPGIFVNVLKSSRQVGVSTLSEAIGVFIVALQNNRFGLIAGDEPESSSHLYGMFRRIYDNLPLWLRPAIVAEKNTYPESLEFDGDSYLTGGAGRTMKGAQQQRGQVGRGKTFSFCHLSELCLWETLSQIRGSLIPAFPIAPSTFVLFESTAKGRSTEWHSWWKMNRSGSVGYPAFVDIFIPWYVEPSYSLEPPSTWRPSGDTLIQAKRIEMTSERWAGRVITPTRGQLYCWERKREAAVAADDLRTFLEEFGAIDDDECFQFSGQTIFPAEVLDRIQSQMKPLLGACEIVPQKELR